MKRLGIFVGLASILLITLVMQWKATDKKKKGKRGKRGVISVEIGKVTRDTIVSRAHFIGSLQPRFQYTVSPQIGGRLSQLKVQVGDRVKQKQLLAVIENNEIIQQVEQAIAEVRVANAQVDEQRSKLNSAKLEYRRTHFLNKKSLVSQAERERTESAHKVEQARLRVVQAQLAQKRALLKAARVRLSYTRIYARWISRPLSLARTRALMEASDSIEPTKPNQAKKNSPRKTPKKSKAPKKSKKRKPTKKKSKKSKKTKKSKKSKKTKKRSAPKARKNGKNGKKPPKEEGGFRIVGERTVDEGSLVQPNTPMLTLLDISSVIAVIYATEKDYIQLHPGQLASATTYVYRNRKFTGRIVRIAPLLQETSRLARVEVEFPNPDMSLKPGMFVRIQIDLKRHPNATLIPRKALVRHKDKDGVYWVDPVKKTANFIAISAGIQTRDLLEILSPALSGHVVTLGYHLLKDKASIQWSGSTPKKAKPPGKRKSNAKGRRKRGGG